MLLELFKGTGSVGKVFSGETYSLDNDCSTKPSICIDFLEWDYKTFLKNNKVQAVWASPPCTTYSLAARDHHRRGGEVITEEAKIADKIIDRLLLLVNSLPADIPWFIENPRGKLKLDTPFKHTVYYCQYGFEYQKPTIIWTNCASFKPTGIKCEHKKHKKYLHSCSRGADRYKMPPKLCEEIVKGFTSLEKLSTSQR